MTAKTLERDLEILEKYRKYADMAELRVDCLDPDERLLIRRFPEQAGMPIILTIRRDLDGGRFVGGEGARVSLMARGLAYAEADRRRNFAFLDIEDDLDVPSLEEAAQTFGTRIIRSYHNTKGTDTDLVTRIRSMRHSENEIVKISVAANSTRDVLSLLRAGKECSEQEKIIIGMGHYGIYSRILAEQFGSYLSYGTVSLETDFPVAAPGQIGIQELASMYRFRNITKATKIYGVVGNPLKATGSPLFFNSVFELEGTDAVYVPFPADSITDFMEIANELKVEGVSVTVPYKEAVIPFLDSLSDDVRNIGACNTLSLTPQGWLGTNTDARGFSDSLLAFLGIPNFKRKRITVIGAGGAARAVVFELHRLGAKVLILNRTALKARGLAAPYKFAWGGLDDRKIEMVDKYHDIIIQTTSVGMEGTETGEFAGPKDTMDTKDPTGLKDPLAMYSFSGREEVMDLVYKPKTTPFLRRASHAGCNVLNGYDMLIRQARYQYVQFTGKEFPEHFTSKVQFGET
jgi:3-dehydroquinate dehydratase/shikimate dehydrogenase